MPRIRYRGRLKQLSNVNYEQRDNFQMEIAAVEQANRREQDDFENQVRAARRCHIERVSLPSKKADAAFSRGNIDVLGKSKVIG